MSEGVSTCRHCGKRIVLTGFSYGPSWVHQRADASFQDRIHIYCKTAVAEPVEEPTDE